MEKRDLKVGYILETRCGEKILVCNTGEWINFKGIKISEIGYLKNLIDKFNNEQDIIKVYEDYTLTNLLWERKEFKLTKDEKAILINLPKEYKYIARDSNELLFVYLDCPTKKEDIWQGLGGTAFPFLGIFKFITWEDEEPYLISDLLEEEN